MLQHSVPPSGPFLYSNGVDPAREFRPIGLQHWFWSSDTNTASPPIQPTISFRRMLPDHQSNRVIEPCSSRARNLMFSSTAPVFVSEHQSGLKTTPPTFKVLPRMCQGHPQLTTSLRSVGYTRFTLVLLTDWPNDHLFHPKATNTISPTNPHLPPCSSALPSAPLDFSTPHILVQR